MTTTQEVTVWCDGPDCMAWTYGRGNSTTIQAARDGAKDQGWTYGISKGPGLRRMVDLCPDCSSDRSNQ